MMAINQRILKFRNPVEEGDKTDKFVGRSAALFEPRIRHEQIRDNGTVLTHSIFEPSTLRFCVTLTLWPWK